jgi:hypothetical protein
VGLDQRYRVVTVVTDNNKSGRERERLRQSSVDMRQRHASAAAAYGVSQFPWRGLVASAFHSGGSEQPLCYLQDRTNARCVQIYDIVLRRRWHKVRVIGVPQPGRDTPRVVAS